MKTSNAKKCLIISYGPVPTPQYQTVEGGGMRVWGLATGLSGHGIDVTVGINNSFPQEISEHDGISLVNWGLDSNFIETLNSFDCVIISYCMGDPSVFVAENLNPTVQLILDVYVPIYVEVSARESDDIESEYKNYQLDIARHNKVLQRGDYFLCANDAQKDLYIGILSSLGVINPHSYRDERLIIAPFGIHDDKPVITKNPYLNLGVRRSDYVVMWFGGLYPWFRIEELLGSLKDLAGYDKIKVVFVGGKNPFNPNPDFYRQYDKTVAFAKKHKLHEKSVFFVDWVDYDDRVNWYGGADVVISLNQPGEENRYSWRTRVMDYVWGDLAIITNGGDPLSEDLLSHNAAIRLDELSSTEITRTIITTSQDKKVLQSVHSNISLLKSKYYWPTITLPIKKIVESGLLPYAEEKTFKSKLSLTENNIQDLGMDHNDSKIRRLVRQLRKSLGYVKSKGVARSIKLSVNIIRTQLKARALSSKERRFVFISHPIDNTGAPLVLLSIVEEYARKYGAKRIQLVAPGILPAQLERMHRAGVSVDKAALGISFRLIRLQLGLRKDDFVLMNTVAIYDNYRDFIFIWLKSKRLKHAYWFIHEDPAQIPIIHKEFLEEKNISQVKKLVKQQNLTLLAPSRRTAQQYNELIGIDQTRSINLHIDVDNKYAVKRRSSEYSKVNFLLSGTPADGRKGQMIAISAFYTFLKKYYEKSPDSYREFNIHLVAIGNDYLSQQIRWIGKSQLDKRVKFYESVPREKALKISSKCNAVICCSLNETFGLYVAEGMIMGHLVLRNNSSGMVEQLNDGVNGFYIDHTDTNQFADVIEKTLNKEITSNEALQRMGVESQEMIKRYQSQSYLDQIEHS